MSKSINDWLAEGEGLYDGALAEYKELEAQRSELKKRMEEKMEQVNRIAVVIGKPQIELRSRSSSSSSSSSSSGSGSPISATVIDSRTSQQKPVTMMNTANTIARALQGREIGR